MRPPAESAVAANADRVQTPAAKETAQVRAPDQAAVQAAPDEATETPTSATVAEIAPSEDTADQNAAPAVADSSETSESNATTAEATDTAAAPTTAETDQSADQPTQPVVQLPELSIPSNSRAAQLASGDDGAAAQVQVEAIPAPAPRVITDQGEAAAANAQAETETAQVEPPTVIDGIAVPDSETLDELEEGAERVASSGLPAVDTPAIAVPQPTETEDTAGNSETDSSAPTRVQSTQVAAIPGFEDLRILFAGADSIVGPQGTALIMGLSQRLNRDESLRLQVRAYAGGTPEAATQARRLSLDRALAVRSMLIDQGVRGTRIDIRALGNSAPEEPRDRVDLIIQ